MLEKIRAGEGTIDAEVAGPEGSKTRIGFSHGRYNDMNNHVTESLFEELSKEYISVRFNFSYVGKPGASEPDIGESLIELEACMERAGGSNIVLIGKSYGSYVSVKAALAHPDKISRVICIGYPFNDAEDNRKTSDQLPLLGGIADKLVFISGSNDPHCRLGRFMRDLPKQAKFYMLNGADHSLNGRDAAATARNMAEALRLAKETIAGILQ